jgi:hypothetical protein
MKILFCSNLLKPKSVDEAFHEEYKNALKNGFETLLFNFEEKSLESIVENNELEECIYRGWMLNPIEYNTLFKELLSKNYRLINTPVEYQNCHYLPNSLKFIEKYTPKTIYQKIENENSIEQLLENAKVFNGKSVVIKDYVKSEKHYWKTAFFVEDSKNMKKLKDTIINLIDLRENYLNEGIVIREYIELKNMKIHSKVIYRYRKNTGCFSIRINFYVFIIIGKKSNTVWLNLILKNLRKLQRRLKATFLQWTLQKTKMEIYL